MTLITEMNEMSLNDLRPFDDDVPEHIKNKKRTPKKKRIKKKDKLKEIEENFKKRIYSACSTGEVDLLECVGVDVKDNKTTEEGNEAFLKLLNSSIDEHGNTPLHIAALNGHELAINWLMNNEASPCNKNDKLQTPYTINADKNIRDVFKTYAKLNPEKYSYPKVGKFKINKLPYETIKYILLFKIKFQSSMLTQSVANMFLPFSIISIFNTYIQY